MPTKTEAMREAEQARYELKLKLLALANGWRASGIDDNAEIGSLLKVMLREINAPEFDQIVAVFRGTAVDERSHEEQVGALAYAFSRSLTKEVGMFQLREIARKNLVLGLGSDVCASHDYCDANMPMLEAFKETFGREPAFLGDAGSPEADVDTGLINAAWSKAKRDWPT